MQYSINHIMPPRNHPHPPRSKKFLPYFFFLLFSAIFVFKVDTIITQTLSATGTSFKGQTKSYGSEIVTIPANGTFHRHFMISWGDSHAQIREDGELLTLSLDKASGSGFESKKQFLFAKISMQIKLIRGNAAGTIATYYLSSEGDQHDAIDIEFIGNSSGNPYTLHTNVFTQGKGEREQQFFLWFDPTIDFHTYSILWNPKCIIFYVDDIPIREFKNLEKHGIRFPIIQPMRLYSSIWNADDWATQGGRVKTDWSLAPFIASYTNYSADGCIWSYRARVSSCKPGDELSKPWLESELDSISRARMKILQRDHMMYDYCKDTKRFSKGPAPECGLAEEF